MAYGLKLSIVSGKKPEVTIISTHNGEGIGEKITRINGHALKTIGTEGTNLVLDTAQSRKDTIFCILTSGKKLEFRHDDISDEGE